MNSALRLAVLAAALLTGAAAHAEGALTLTLENDVLTGTDNNYTNGLGITWSSDGRRGDEDDAIARWIRVWDFLPFVGNDGYTTYASFSLAQEMHTPDSITDSTPSPDDQPYAGVLYVDSVLYARRDGWAHAFELKLGVVGSNSQADDVQKGFHRAIGADQPQGWHTQLPNEPIVNVGYTVAHLLAQGSAAGGTSWRFVPVGSVGLGNYFTGASVGAYGEIGWNLVDAFGGTALRDGLNAASTVGAGPVHGWSVSFYGGVNAYGVVHYLPLDGTVFSSSRSVESKPVIGGASLGVAIRHRNWVLGVGATYSTKAFGTEQSAAEFGTVSLSGYF